MCRSRTSPHLVHLLKYASPTMTGFMGEVLFHLQGGGVFSLGIPKAFKDCGAVPFAYAELDSSDNVADVMLPGKGWATFNFPVGSNSSSVNYRNNLWLEKMGPSGGVTNLILHYPDGASASYSVLDSSD